MHIDMYVTFSVNYGEGMGIPSLLVMITLGLDMYIGDLMPWIHSLNLRWDQITYWVYIPSHFDQIKVICLVSLILSIGERDYFLVMYTRVSITKWIGGKKISNLDGHSEMMDRFLISSQILVRICLIDCLRCISIYEISKRFLGYQLYSQDHRRYLLTQISNFFMKTI